jgi:glycosyltransferase involved in cell wall biosynthesis
MSSVSVALCTHNGARFLQAQVSSICTQTHAPAELVLSDDASADGSVELVCRTLQDHAQRTAQSPIALRVLHNAQPLGARANFEQAVRHCTGEFIVLCDQDDVWQPDRLRRLVEFMAARQDLDLVHSDARLVDSDGQPLGKTLFQAFRMRPRELEQIHAGAALEVLLRRSCVTGATTLFRRRLLESALPFPPEWWHDEWLALIAAAVGRTDVIEEALIDYRQHAANVIGVPPRMSWFKNTRSALAPGGSLRRRNRLARAEVLWEKVRALGTSVRPERASRVEELLAHERLRASLPQARAARLGPVLQEALSGRYGRFSFGLRSVARDLLVSM